MEPSDKLSVMASKKNPYNVLVGDRLKAVRAYFDIKTKRAMARELNVDEDRYSSWEKGKNGLPNWVPQQLRESRGVSVEWLTSRDPKRIQIELFPMKVHP